MGVLNDTEDHRELCFTQHKETEREARTKRLSLSTFPLCLSTYLFYIPPPKAFEALPSNTFFFGGRSYQHILGNCNKLTP